MHSHTVHLPLGALLIGCAVCGTGTPPFRIRSVTPVVNFGLSETLEYVLHMERQHVKSGMRARGMGCAF